MLRHDYRERLMPAAAEGFDEGDGGDEALAGDLMHAALGDERGAAGFDDFQIRARSGGVAKSAPNANSAAETKKPGFLKRVFSRNPK